MRVPVADGRKVSCTTLLLSYSFAYHQSQSLGANASNEWQRLLPSRTTTGIVQGPPCHRVGQLITQPRMARRSLHPLRVPVRMFEARSATPSPPTKVTLTITLEHFDNPSVPKTFATGDEVGGYVSMEMPDPTAFDAVSILLLLAGGDASTFHRRFIWESNSSRFIGKSIARVNNSKEDLEKRHNEIDTYKRHSGHSLSVGTADGYGLVVFIQRGMYS